MVKAKAIYLSNKVKTGSWFNSLNVTANVKVCYTPCKLNLFVVGTLISCSPSTYPSVYLTATPPPP